MGLYFEHIYPTLMEKALNKQSVNDLRKKILSKAEGEVLEIGFGTGLNLAYYPEHISSITAIDLYENINSKVKKRIEDSKIEVHSKTMNVENLLFENNSFDCVVSTFTFCSIENMDKALAEIYRVLKPGGKLLFLEHGLNPDEKAARMQNIINPVFKVISCRLNRDMEQIIKTQKFKIIQIDQFLQKEMAKIVGWLYMGVAVKPE